MLPARYADGKAAITTDVEARFGAEAVLFRLASGSGGWRYENLRRGDDNNGHIVLRLEPDTGERLIFDQAQADALRAAWPAGFSDHAHGRESWRLVGGLAGAAAALAALFLIGVPLAAKPLSKVLPQGYADRMGAIAWAQVEEVGQRCDMLEDAEALTSLDRLTDRLLVSTSPETQERVRLHVMRADAGPLAQPNAFALPDGSIVLTKALIDLAQSPDEVAGVIAHEIGHVEERHIMASVIRNIGAGVFFDVVFGGAGMGQAIAIASVNLASLGYTREDEAEADQRAYDFLETANLDPAAMGDMFDRLASLEGRGADAPDLLQTHPNTAARAEAARARAHPSPVHALTPYEWAQVRRLCASLPSQTAPGPARPSVAPLPAPGPHPAPGPAPTPGPKTPQGAAAPQKS